MKNTMILMTVLAITASVGIIGCNTASKEKVKIAKEDVADAQKKLEEANAAYADDVAKFKTETSERIAANEKIATDFKGRIKMEKKSAKADYEKRIADLEKKNGDMKKTMDEYKADGKENWESFKSEFNHDMDELGNAFNDLTVNNVKK